MKSGRYSKPSNKKGALGQGKSRAQANIAGYEKRLARKAKSTSTTDLYEHIPEKTRRSKVVLDLGRDEEFELPDALDGADDKEREELRARLIGENQDDEEIVSEDDEEIDSDAAFEETDEERFAGFFSRKKKAKSKSTKSSKHKLGVRFANVDLNEDEDVDVGMDDHEEDSDEEEEGDDDEFVDLLDILDENSDSEKPEDYTALDQLNEFVSNLDVTSNKRKAAEEPSEAGVTRSRKRRLVKERTEAGAENEFRARSSGLKLNIDDLLAPLASQSSALQSLKASAKVLAPSSSSKAKTMSAPLPQRTQERLDRQAAYEQTKEEVDKWSETMKHIRDAEHLSFPLQSQSAGCISNLELTAKFKPTTALESSVDALLKSAKLRDEDIQHTEDAMLQMNNVSVEEVAQRRGELRKMRELMFRAEVKARRVGKIKSKTYRRIKRKEKERLDEKINQDEDQDEEEVLKKELDRARERATLRHKHTGKWARQMRNKVGVDEDSRRDIEDMLARGEKLRRRIKGVGSDESEDGSEDQDDDADADGLDVEDGLEKIKHGAFDELRKLNEAEKVEGDGNQKGKGVFEMKFMKDAMARQMQATNQSMDDFIKEMGGNAGTDDSDDEEEENGLQVLDSSSGVLVRRTGGRITIQHPLDPSSGVSVRRTGEHVTNLHPLDSSSGASVGGARGRVTSQHPLESSSEVLVQGTGGRVTSQHPPVVHADDEDSGSNSEVEVQENALTLKGNGKENSIKAFEQRDLVALAFAGDNVVQNFEEAKSREIASDAPREVDTTIPGWGSWGGAGIRKLPSKPQRIKKIAGIDPTTRADFNKKYIIISEKRDKKAGKYLVKDLPYPYTSKAQFERAMEHPLGAEWNTRVAFQRGTLPKVVKKPGVIINPLEKMTS